jgi:hypothetical protein
MIFDFCRFVNIVALYVFVLMYSTFGGAVDLGCNVLLVEIWTGNEAGPSAMNLLHFMWGVGSFLSPLVAEGVGLQPSQMQATWAAIGITSAVLGVPLWFVPSPRPPLAPAPTAAKDADASGAEKGETSDGTDSGSGDKVDATHPAAISRFAFGAAIFAMSLYYFCYSG